MLKEQWTEPPVFLSVCVSARLPQILGHRCLDLEDNSLNKHAPQLLWGRQSGRRRERERGQGLGQSSLKSKLMSYGLQRKTWYWSCNDSWKPAAGSYTNTLKHHINLSLQGNGAVLIHNHGIYCIVSSNTPINMNSASISIISVFHFYLVIWSSILLRYF